jgi:murein DD-endopeptidase MepM/ murein hydrolase activator NlpD
LYRLWQRGRSWLNHLDTASLNIVRATINLAVVLTVLIAALVAFSVHAYPNLNRESLGHNAIIGLILAPTDQVYDEEVLEEGPSVLTDAPQTITYLDATALRAELQPNANSSSSAGNLVLSGNEDALLALDIPPTGIRTRANIENYTIQSGDTIGTIARQFGLKATTLLWANNLTERSLLKIGQVLNIPPANGVIYATKKGDTLAAIAKRYKVAVEQLEEFNRLGDGALKVGINVFIPGAQPLAVPQPARATTPTRLPGQTSIAGIPAAAPTSNTRLQWPTTSRRMTQYYHYRHSAIDVGNKKGEPIYAAEAGVVLRAQWNTGYGYNVVLDHGGGLRTLYGHSSQLLVRPGQKVTRGQVIALIGSTGRSTGPHLHFEVMVGGVKQNPLSYTR